MEINYEDKKVEILFDDFNLMKRKIGEEITRLIKKRYNQLKAADTFDDFLLTKLGSPHSLTGDKKGCYAISVNKNLRLIVKPITKDLSSESLKECKEIIIKGVEDYHGSKVTTYIP